MPMPVISQPMMTAPGDAPLAMFCGRLNTPPPIIEPTTRATSGNRPSVPDRFSVAEEGVATFAVTMSAFLQLKNLMMVCDAFRDRTKRHEIWSIMRSQRQPVV